MLHIKGVTRNIVIGLYADVTAQIATVTCKTVSRPNDDADQSRPFLANPSKGDPPLINMVTKSSGERGLRRSSPSHHRRMTGNSSMDWSRFCWHRKR